MVQQVAQRLRPRRVEGAADDARMVRAGAQHVQPALIKGMDHVVHSLCRESDTGGDLPAALSGGTRQHDLGATQDKGIGRKATFRRRPRAPKRDAIESC